MVDDFYIILQYIVGRFEEPYVAGLNHKITSLNCTLGKRQNRLSGSHFTNGTWKFTESSSRTAAILILQPHD
jgi:hypothetical protein